MSITEQQLTMNDEEEDKKRERRQRVLLLWTNLTNQFVALDYLNLLDYTRVLSLIRDKVYTAFVLCNVLYLSQLACNRYPKARGYLIWLILFHISANMSPKDQQLNQETVAAVVNLMSAVYQDNEVLCMCVCMCACVCP